MASIETKGNAAVMNLTIDEKSEAGLSRKPLEFLHDQQFDVLIIGGGINGASVASRLSSEGYSVLLVDKGDFGSGSTSRSSRIMHCGLLFLAPDKSWFDHVLKPGRFFQGLKKARAMMRERQGLSGSHLLRPIQCALPVYRDSPFATWELDVGFELLRWPKDRSPKLEYQRLGPSDARQHPIGQYLRDQESLVSLAVYQDYQFDWPERLCIDLILAAEAHGAAVRNYTEITNLRRDENANLWRAVLLDRCNGHSVVEVQADIVINLAGPWVDAVNRTAIATAKAQIAHTKGAHILVKLPDSLQGKALATFGRDGKLFMVVPWRKFHYVGPTETPYDGDPGDATATEDDIAHLVDETNYQLPALALHRSDVVMAWAGVRPNTRSDDPALRKLRLVHDMKDVGCPNLLTMTWGRLADHRLTGNDFLNRVRVLKHPRNTRKHSPLEPRSNDFIGNECRKISADRLPSIVELRQAAEREHVASLTDLLFRRTSVGWMPEVPASFPEHAARGVADILGWDDERIAGEIEAYKKAIVLRRP